MNPDEACPAPAGKDARKRFQSRVSDLRSAKSKLPRALRAALEALPCPLIHPREARFNPALEVLVTLP